MAIFIKIYMNNKIEKAIEIKGTSGLKKECEKISEKFLQELSAKSRTLRIIANQSNINISSLIEYKSPISNIFKKFDDNKTVR